MDTAKYNAVDFLTELNSLPGHWSGRGQEVEFHRNEHIPLEDGRTLGVGGAGRVYKVTWTNPITKKKVSFARKSVYLTNSWPRDAVQNEITLLKKLTHHHIVSFVGSYESEANFHILLLPCAVWDLSGLLDFLDNTKDSSPNERFRELGWSTNGNSVYNSSCKELVQSNLKKMLGCIVRALHYLHENRVRHRDIKPSNILLDSSSVYLTDFNISSTFAQGDISRTAGCYDAGTERYSAPEVLNGESRGRMAEIFSLGLVFMEIFTYVNGYSRKDMVSVMTRGETPLQEWKEKRLSGIRSWVTKIFPATGAQRRYELTIRDLILDMLLDNQDDRPGTFEVASRLAEIDIDGTLHGKCCDKSEVGLKALLRKHDELNEKVDQLIYHEASRSKLS